jgi:hypothetical protein
MPDLGLSDIEEICIYVRKQEISFSHLADDLADHICCDVEELMWGGLCFREAFREVKRRMGQRRLKEIQEETLYAVDTKYRKMKNTMKISGIAGTILFGFASLFKIQHWPMAGIMLVLGALALAFVFMPSALGVLWKETHSRNKLFLFISGFVFGMLFIFGTLFKIQHWPAAGIIITLSVISAFFFILALLINRISDPENEGAKPVYFLGAAGSMLYLTGMLFKIQHWPLSAVLMVLSLIILFFIVLPWYAWIKWKNESHVTSAFIFLIIGALLIVVPGALINLSLKNMYDNGYYSHLDLQQRIFRSRLELTNSFIGQYSDSSCYGQMESLHGKTAGVLNLIYEIEKDMVCEAEGEPGNPAVNPGQVIETEYGQEISYPSLSAPFSMIPGRDFLRPGCPARQAMDSSFAEYRDYITSVNHKIDSSAINGLLDPSVYLSFITRSHKDPTLMSALHSLEVLKNNLLTVELIMLKDAGKKY